MCFAAASGAWRPVCRVAARGDWEGIARGLMGIDRRSDDDGSGRGERSPEGLVRRVTVMERSAALRETMETAEGRWET